MTLCTAIKSDGSFTAITTITAFCLCMYSAEVSCLWRIFGPADIDPAMSQQGHSEAAGQEISPAVAECEDHLSRRQWLLSLEAYALV